MLIIRLSIAIAALSIIGACNQPEQIDTVDPIIASVYDVSLYQSELNSVIHPSVNNRDSVALAKAYLDQWVRDQVLMAEASRYTVDNRRIEKLVDDYRKNLIKFEYENQIVAERFDTVVSELALKSFYEENKQQFILSESVYNVQLAEVIAEKADLKKLYAQWVGDDLKEFSNLSIRSNLDTTLWMNWQQINSWSDKFKVPSSSRSSNQRVSTGNSEIFLKVRESRAIKDFSPLPYVTIQLKQMILHKRKLELLERRKDELYNRALESNEIKIFVE